MTTHSLAHRLRRTGAAVAMLGAGAVISLGAGSGVAQAAAPHEPFACTTSTAFFPLTEFDNPDALTQLYIGVYGEGEMTFSALGTPTHNWNATGYNPADGYLYGYQNEGGKLLQIGADGSVTDLGTTVETLGNYNAGAFDDSGTFWLTGSGAQGIYGLDVSTREGTQVQFSAVLDSTDIVYSHGYMWALKNSTNDLQRIDLATGDILQVPVPGISGGAGGAFAYGNGDLGFLNQSTGSLYRVRLSDAGSANPTATTISVQDAVTAGGADGAACVGNSTDLSVTVQAPEAVPPGQPIDYTLTVSNEGTTNSSGWTLTSELPGNLTDPQTSTPGCSIASGILTCTGGALASGDSVEVAMTGTAPDSGVVIAPATVTSNEADSNPANDNDTAETEIAPDAGAPMASGDVLGAVGGAAVLAGGVMLLMRRRRHGQTEAAA